MGTYALIIYLFIKVSKHGKLIMKTYSSHLMKGKWYLFSFVWPFLYAEWSHKPDEVNEKDEIITFPNNIHGFNCTVVILL